MNAIISAATGYTEKDLQPFLRSIELHSPNSRVFLIVREMHRKNIETMRSKFPFVEPIYIGQKINRGGKVFRSIARVLIKDDFLTRGSLWVKIGRYPMHIMLERFFFALDLVRTHRQNLERVLLTDSRDVILQSDPFASSEAGVISGIEEETIGRCAMNSTWLSHLYGQQVLKRFSDRQIVCAGVTLGGTAAVERYLEEMCGEIWKCLPKVALIAQYDQGIHNFLIYSGRVPVNLTSNRDGIIATLHHENPDNIQAHPLTGEISIRGKVPAIVHQYDRHRNLLKMVHASCDAAVPVRKD